jgi:tRNA G18 (ribose-2'-O)-methylase SpoU
MPHLAAKLDKQISKTALGAEHTQDWQHVEDITAVLQALHVDDFVVAAVEQSVASLRLPDYRPPNKIALLVGREVEGIEQDVIAACDICLEIPMFGHKESFNVVQAAAMALYQCRFAQVAIR